jgi:hypothetical protein
MSTHVSMRALREAVPAEPASAGRLNLVKERDCHDACCGLCGTELSARALHYHVVSPQRCEGRVKACHVCRRAALGEGYRPA